MYAAISSSGKSLFARIFSLLLYSPKYICMYMLYIHMHVVCLISFGRSLSIGSGVVGSSEMFEPGLLHVESISGRAQTTTKAESVLSDRSKMNCFPFYIKVN